MTVNQRNWAGNITYGAQRWHKPESLDQLQAQVRAADKVKVLGSRHSFNWIADTPHDVIELTEWKQIHAIDTDKMTVTVDAGVRHGELAVLLHEAGYALHNLASLPHISVAGAISTATHGSGVTNGNLASVVTGLEIVTADGELLTLSREEDADQFAAAVVGLGAVGVLTKVTLKIEPTYQMRQMVYLDLPFAALESDFEAIMADAYSVSLFTDWTTDTMTQVWVKRRMTESADDAVPFYGARPADRHYHPMAALSAQPCTEQMGIPGAWHERLPHFKLEFTPSSGEELQTEYFVAREHALPALRAISAIREQIAPLLFISEVRTIAADDLWMSPCYQQDRVALHFTWKPDWDAVKPILPIIEERLIPFNAVPHWGKLFTLSSDYIQSQYTKWDDFLSFIQTLDPNGKFRNPFLDSVLFGVHG